jgi:hypothetical protein
MDLQIRNGARASRAVVLRPLYMLSLSAQGFGGRLGLLQVIELIRESDGGGVALGFLAIIQSAAEFAGSLLKGGLFLRVHRPLIVNFKHIGHVLTLSATGAATI